MIPFAPPPFQLRAVDERGRYQGTLVVLELGAIHWTCRWAGQAARWQVTEAELTRLTQPARVKA